MSPNQPKTPVSSFRLDAADKATIARVAAAMQTSATEAIRLSTRAMNRFAVHMNVREPMACPLGHGHTSHIWELPAEGRRAEKVYYCAGQPFANGYDPIDDESAQSALKAFGFMARGLQPCCGASNEPCRDTHPLMTNTGCEKCGHPEGCHI